MTLISEKLTDDDYMTDYVKRKDELQKTAFAFKKSLLGELKDFKFNADKWSKTALVVGGAVVATYIVYRMLRSGGKSSHKGGGSKPVKITTYKEESPIIRMIKESIATFLLAIAKQKLMEFLEQQHQKAAANEQKAA